MRKRNKFNHKAFDIGLKRLETAVPQGIKKAFYIADIKQSQNLPDSLKAIAVSAVCEYTNGNLDLRVYRHSGEENPLYDVDEYRGVNRTSIDLPDKGEIENHHLNEKIADDIMHRNELTQEFVDDGEGGFKPNVGPDGMVKALINFEDPMEKIKRDFFGKN